MNKDQIQGRYEKLKGRMKQTWGRLTDDDLALFQGQEEEFYGRLQEKYGLARQAAEKLIKEMEREAA